MVMVAQDFCPHFVIQSLIAALTRDHTRTLYSVIFVHFINRTLFNIMFAVFLISAPVSSLMFRSSAFFGGFIILKCLHFHKVKKCTSLCVSGCTAVLNEVLLFLQKS